MRRLYVIVRFVSYRVRYSDWRDCMGVGRSGCAAFVHRDCFCDTHRYRHIKGSVTYQNQGYFPELSRLAGIQLATVDKFAK